MREQVVAYFRKHLHDVEFASLRFVEQQNETLHMRQQVLSPPSVHSTQGVFIAITKQGGTGYAATGDLSDAGIRWAIEQASQWAVFSTARNVLSNSSPLRPQQSGRYQSPCVNTWQDVSLKDKIAYLSDSSKQLKSHENIVDWQSHLNYRHTHSTLVTSDNIEIEQAFSTISPGLHVIAADHNRTQERSGGGWGLGQQGGLERLLEMGFPSDAARISDEALQLLNAPDCPSGTLDLLLMPSQMMLQIHESIGHPLELDRILGDERNYAGRTSRLVRMPTSRPLSTIGTPEIR